MAFGSGVSRQFYCGSNCQPPSPRPGQPCTLLLQYQGEGASWHPGALVCCLLHLGAL